MSVDGAWTVTVQSPMGPQTNTLTLTSSGGALTGTASTPQGSQDIADGKVDGDNVSWKASITTPFPMTLEFSGKVEGDKMSGSVKAGSFGSFPFSGVRA